ncbi:MULTISPECIES: GPW/gp25 family protein [unclassified Paracoccus (in: a-proteobacteria)]|uniref:GPW/gp25 family protein n=1 Tax=unclassified Paracoccus (in: a-proteobacteria) TaxID=2688777 RepID=UPI0016027718|nr:MULTISPECIES: GPW/gp25 family protein [unclassified Paracoccus (in: a-proteobacteria)]MBB1492345.1 GPW/gp25 family protein [Paracoccus sp. MC1854]MBB1498424.1 GPW/gp25 family protein [Paracoccus sp. MC1862]QQO46659.1 GPW/gp25 family protein [Paracoccus sp. MC1862]
MAGLQGWLFDPLGGPALAADGAVAMVGGPALISQSLMILLGTVPGERVMRPDYGCPLDRLVFAPNDATTAGLAIHYVRQALRRWEPRVDILRLDAGPDPQGAPEALRIWLEYRIRRTVQHGSLGFTLDLGGPHA